MATASDISSRIVDALYISDPQLDTSIGTPTRKIIDAVSSEIASASVDSYLTDYQYDVDSKSGGDLDDFVANFGLARLIGTRATGTITFARSMDSASNQAVSIGPGVQVVTGNIPQQIFQTTISTSLAVGQTSVDIASQAVDVGPDSNILANTPLQLVNTIPGISTVSNSAAFVGGSSDETDDQLRTRFKTTVFRNLAGTDQMYRGIALQTIADANAGSFGVASTNILGSVNHNNEQIQIVSGTANVSLNTAAYFVSTSVYITDLNGNVYTPRNQYNVTVNNSANPATMTINSLGSAANMPDGVYNVDYDYVPIVSRNDPFNTRWAQGAINNRVDVYVNGQIAAPGNQNLVYLPSVKFSNITTGALYYQKFVTPRGANPTVNDVFIPLGFGPVMTIPQTITLTVAGSPYTWYYGVNYDVVHQDDAFGYTPNSLFGLWWRTTTNTTNPATNQLIPFNYTYNSIPTTVMNNLANWRLLGTDVQVHAGKIAYLVLNLAIVYDKNVNTGTVATNINTAVDSYLKRLGFNAAVQISDLTQVIHNVPGVDNVRFLSSTDNGSTYGIQRVQSDGTLVTTYNVSGRPTDVYFDERTYPLLYAVNLSVKANNTFRT